MQGVMCTLNIHLLEGGITHMFNAKETKICLNNEETLYSGVCCLITERRRPIRDRLN